MTNIQEETFEILEINDIETLFSNGRINRKEVPAGFSFTTFVMMTRAKTWLPSNLK